MITKPPSFRFDPESEDFEELVRQALLAGSRVWGIPPHMLDRVKRMALDHDLSLKLERSYRGWSAVSIPEPD